MHMYQKEILDTLRGSKTVRYGELQPEGVESSHFKYHLDQLINDGLVRQDSRGVYALTTKGKSSVDRLSTDRITPRQSPKVITYTLLQDDDTYYLYQKTKEPYLGLLNMVGGKVHSGDSPYDSAIREVQEKAGIVVDELEEITVASIRIMEDDVLLTHVIAYVYVADVDASALHSGLVPVPRSEISEAKGLAPDLLPVLEVIDDPEDYPSVDLLIDMV